MTYCTMHHAAQGENLIVNGQKTCWLQFGQKPVGRQQRILRILSQILGKPILSRYLFLIRTELKLGKSVLTNKAEKPHQVNCHKRRLATATANDSPLLKCCSEPGP